MNVPFQKTVTPGETDTVVTVGKRRWGGRVWGGAHFLYLLHYINR